MGSGQDLEPDFSGDLSSHHLFISVVILSFLTFLLLCYLIVRSFFGRERGMHEINVSRSSAGNAVRDHVITIPAPAVGLDDAAISGLPVFVFVKSEEAKDADRSECSICLGVYEEDEMVKVLPVCRHSFHSDCVDAWLRGRATCPLCRMPLDASCSKAAALADSS